MKKLSSTTFITVFLFFCAIGTLAQTPDSKLNPVCLDDTKQFSITSKHVAGENFIIQVGLPSSYSSSKKSYPVLYVLDGDVSFGVTNEIARWMMFSKEIKDIIVIGIGYGQGMNAWYVKRARDLTHCPDANYAKSFKTMGEADIFLKFIQNEVFPVVNKNYRTNPDSIAISGTSLGGLLSTYILCTQPETFRGYIAISPTIGWNNRSIIKLSTEYFNSHTEFNKTVFMACGSLDGVNWVINPTNELYQLIKSHNYSGTNIVSRVFDGETHMSVYFPAITNGIKTLFKP